MCSTAPEEAVGFTALFFPHPPAPFCGKEIGGVASGRKRVECDLKSEGYRKPGRVAPGDLAPLRLITLDYV